MPRPKATTTTEDTSWQDQFIDETIAGDALTDPLEDLSAHDQDLFFRMLDTIEDPQHREEVMAYMMDHPALVAGVIEYAKQQREALQSDNIPLMEQFLQREKVVLEAIERDEFGNIDDPVATSQSADDDDYNPLNDI